jgi:hypothetical protein
MTAPHDALVAAVRGQGGKFSPIAVGEPVAHYLTRLYEAVSMIPKRVFDQMPEPAQTWFDNAATALSEATAVPVPEGFDQPAAAPTGPPPPAPRRLPRPTGSALPVGGLPRPLPPPRAEADDSVATRVARLVIADDAIPLTTLISRLKAQGVAAHDATVRQHRIMVRAILRLIREAGWQPPSHRG